MRKIERPPYMKGALRGVPANDAMTIDAPMRRACMKTHTTTPEGYVDMRTRYDIRN